MVVSHVKFCAFSSEHVTSTPAPRPLAQALTEYRAELRDDPIINTHLAKLYDNLLEQNLIRVIEPFSRVQVTGCQACFGRKERVWRALKGRTKLCGRQELIFLIDDSAQMFKAVFFVCVCVLSFCFSR